MSIQDINIPGQPDQQDDELRGERVRIRKRIRVKKKKSPKRKIRKLLDRVVWTVIIAAFVLTLFYLLRELDLNDKKFKRKKQGSFLNIELYSKPPETQASFYVPVF